MDIFPTIHTDRLLLNQPTDQDAFRITKILSSSTIYYQNTLNIPYPYSLADAEFFIDKIVRQRFINNEAYIWAIRQTDKETLIGIIELSLDANNSKAEAGYWLEENYWNMGYTTEVLKKVITFAFENLKLNKIYATHHLDNMASGRVMQKCGMEYEGTLRQEVKKENHFIDLVRYSILNKD